jgi:hypothetical protein
MSVVPTFVTLTTALSYPLDFHPNPKAIRLLAI